MKKNKYLIAFAVSLYGLFFVIAFWSALPPIVTGGTAGTASIVEQQITACDLPIGPVEGQEASQIQSNNHWYSHLLGGPARVPYQCALMTGTLYN